VIATAAIGSGATERIQQQIASIGSNLIIILPGSLTSSGMRMGTGNAVTLTESDTRELSAECPDIAMAVPIVRGGAQIVYENNNWATVVYGTTPGYLDVRDIPVHEGMPFTQQDVDSANKVALPGRTVVT
jgi:putative ABC transport system permease protein